MSALRSYVRAAIAPICWVLMIGCGASGGGGAGAGFAPCQEGSTWACTCDGGETVQAPCVDGSYQKCPCGGAAGDAAAGDGASSGASSSGASSGGDVSSSGASSSGASSGAVSDATSSSSGDTTSTSSGADANDGKCAIDQDCPTAQFCDGGTCKDDTCVPGATICVDVLTAGACKANGSGYANAPCASAANCVNGTCICNTPGKKAPQCTDCIDSKFTGPNCAQCSNPKASPPSCTVTSDPCDCKAIGATCGFVPGCPSSCGACPVGQACKSNKCTNSSGTTLAKLGAFCGPTKDCQPPVLTGSESETVKTQKQQAYRACLNAQCDGSLCFDNVCTKQCVIKADKIANGTGFSGQDGIEDVGASSDCDGAVSGPQGSNFRCVELRSAAEVAQGQSFSFCMPGQTFKACANDKDCLNAETCQIQTIYGQPKTVCQPARSTPKGGGFVAGAAVGTKCGNNPYQGVMSLCAAGLCWSDSLGCVSFCKTDADCGPYKCTQRTVYSNVADKFGVCWPKGCQLDGDCKGTADYCFLLYNGVKNPAGDPDPTNPQNVIKPAWENMCIPQTPGGAQTGAACDPYTTDDEVTGPNCANDLLCENAVCGNLCASDTDCVSGMKCDRRVSSLDVDGDTKNGSDVFLPYGTCKPYKGASGACLGQKDCAGKYCKPLGRKVASASSPYSTTLTGTCVTQDASKGVWGDHCGAMNTGSGAKKVCKSGNCWNTTNSDGEAIPGLCVDMCKSQAECAGTVTLYQTQYKSWCRSVFYADNDTDDERDRMYLPVCWVAGTTESLADCSSTFKCGSSTEACLAAPIARGPDESGAVEYICRSSQNTATQGTPNPPQPSKSVGQACQLESNWIECKSIYCVADSKVGAGYCSQPCKSDAECGSGDGMFCDKASVWIPRRDASKSVIVPMCRKKKSCIPCAGDWDCAGGYKCTNVGGQGTLAKQVCAPPCTSDASCAGTDGGSKCVPAVDNKLQSLPVNVCKPSC